MNVAPTAPMSEKQFQDEVSKLARNLGWADCHVHPARAGKRFITPTSRPIPDLILWKPGRLIWRELKVPRGAGGRILDGQWKPGQRETIAELQAAGEDVAVWTPDDLDSGLIRRELGAS